MRQIVQDSDDECGLEDPPAERDSDVLYLGERERERDSAASSELADTLAQDITKAQTALFDDIAALETRAANAARLPKTASASRVEVVIPLRRTTRAAGEHLIAEDDQIAETQTDSKESRTKSSTRNSKAATRNASKRKRGSDDSTMDELSSEALPKRRSPKRSSPKASERTEIQASPSLATDRESDVFVTNPTDTPGLAPSIQHSAPNLRADASFKPEVEVNLVQENVAPGFPTISSPARQSRKNPKLSKTEATKAKTKSKPPEHNSQDKAAPVLQATGCHEDLVQSGFAVEETNKEASRKSSNEHMNYEVAEGDKENVTVEVSSSAKAKPKLDSRPQVSKPVHRVGLSRLTQLPSLLKVTKR